MPNLKEIKAKIGSVKNTQKTTRAMKLVSTAKLRKTEQLARKAKDYSEKINEVASSISFNMNKHNSGSNQNIFLSKKENIKVVDILFVTADKGLCGGFNVQTIKNVKNLIEKYESEGIKVRLRAVGKKGVEYFNFKKIPLLQSTTNLSSSPTYERAKDFIDVAIDDYINGDTDKIVLVHNGFKNMLSQEISINDLLPVAIEKCVDCESNTNSSLMEVEPEDDEEEILNSLIQKYLEFNMYYALVDSLAAEHSSRMQAMDAATKNAKEMVGNLTLKYNKIRQESITTELIEIISGVESLKS